MPRTKWASARCGSASTLRRAYANNRGLMIREEPAVVSGPHVTKRLALPNLSREAEGAAGVPAMSGEAESAFSGDENEKAVPRHDRSLTPDTVAWQRRHCPLQEFRVVIVVIIELLQDGSSCQVDGQVHFGSSESRTLEPNMSDTWYLCAQGTDILLSVIDDEELGSRVRLTDETSERLREETRPVARRHDARDQLVRGRRWIIDGRGHISPESGIRIRLSACAADRTFAT